MGNSESAEKRNDWNSDESDDSDFEHAYDYHSSVLLNNSDEPCSPLLGDNDEDVKNMSPNVTNVLTEEPNFSTSTAFDSVSSSANDISVNAQSLTDTSDSACSPSSTAASLTVFSYKILNENYNSYVDPIEASNDERTINNKIFQQGRYHLTTHQQNSADCTSQDTFPLLQDQRKRAMSDICNAHQENTSPNTTEQTESDHLFHKQQRLEKPEATTVQSDDHSSLSIPLRQFRLDSEPISSLSSVDDFVDLSVKKDSEEKNIGETIRRTEDQTSFLENWSGDSGTSRTCLCNLTDRAHKRSARDWESLGMPAEKRQICTRGQEGQLSCRLHARKRTSSAEDDCTPKRSRTDDAIQLSPDRKRFGIFDTQPESDSAPHCTPKKMACRSRWNKSPHQTRKRHIRAFRQSAKRTALQFVETSRKILREAKAAARIFKQTTANFQRVVSGRDRDVIDNGGGQHLRNETENSDRIGVWRRDEKLDQLTAMPVSMEVTTRHTEPGFTKLERMADLSRSFTGTMKQMTNNYLQRMLDQDRSAKEDSITHRCAEKDSRCDTLNLTDAVRTQSAHQEEITVISSSVPATPSTQTTLFHAQNSQLVKSDIQFVNPFQEFTLLPTGTSSTGYGSCDSKKDYQLIHDSMSSFPTDMSNQATASFSSTHRPEAINSDTGHPMETCLLTQLQFEQASVTGEHVAIATSSAGFLDMSTGPSCDEMSSMIFHNDTNISPSPLPTQFMQRSVYFWGMYNYIAVTLLPHERAANKANKRGKLKLVILVLFILNIVLIV